MANDSEESMLKDHSNMKRSDSPLITEPSSFRSNLDSLVASLEQLYLACAPESAQLTTADEWPTTFFSLTARQERPGEFLQCWLDLIHVMFEPNPPGTMYLNSNWNFVCDSVPQEPFRLGYLSLVFGGDNVQDFASELKRRLGALRYDLDTAYASFVCVVMGTRRYRTSGSITKQVQNCFSSGMSVQDTLDAFSTIASGKQHQLRPGSVYVGAALEPAFPNEWLRGSVLTFLPHTENSLLVPLAAASA